MALMFVCILKFSEDSASLPYFIRRTKNHMYPVYEEVRHDNQLLTKVAKIEGDIWV